jgi:phosphoribosylglycinamide formyltransferase-1
MKSRGSTSARRVIGVLCSGHGTNLQAIMQAIRSGRLRARIAVVVSDRADARALTRAHRSGIPAQFVDPRAFAGREAFDRALIRILETAGVRVVCLAGFMRLLSPVFVRRFSHRILNVHPALLPAFPGAHAVRDALAWGATVTGVTMHLVDEAMDHGPIVLQEALAIRPGESASHLRSRLHRIEHRLYPRAIELVLAGRVRVRGRVVQLT